MVYNTCLKNLLLKVRDMMKDLIGKSRGFNCCFDVVVSDLFALKWAFDSCLPVETFNAKLFKKGKASERPVSVFWGQVTVGLSAFLE